MFIIWEENHPLNQNIFVPDFANWVHVCCSTLAVECDWNREFLKYFGSLGCLKKIMFFCEKNCSSGTFFFLTRCLPIAIMPTSALCSFLNVNIFQQIVNVPYNATETVKFLRTFSIWVYFEKIDGFFEKKTMRSTFCESGESLFIEQTFSLHRQIFSPFYKTKVRCYSI